ncbi:MAG: hypothetical protein QM767_18210 [Anaeromyxobacter sp.]
MNLAAKRPDPARAFPSAAALAALLAASMLAGCDRDGVTHFRVPRERAQPLAMPAAMTGAPPGMQGDVPPPPPVEGGLRWSLPQGWTEARGGGGMRFATLKPAVPGKVDVSVVVLSGAAGGELANVNRWRNQNRAAAARRGRAGPAAAHGEVRRGAGHALRLHLRGAAAQPHRGWVRPGGRAELVHQAERGGGAGGRRAPRLPRAAREPSP